MVSFNGFNHCPLGIFKPSVVFVLFAALMSTSIGGNSLTILFLIKITRSIVASKLWITDIEGKASYFYRKAASNSNALLL